MSDESNEERVGRNESIFREINEHRARSAFRSTSTSRCAHVHGASPSFPGTNDWSSSVVAKVGVAGEVAEDEDPRTG
jgi:hypothetical protein